MAGRDPEIWKDTVTNRWVVFSLVGLECLPISNPKHSANPNPAQSNCPLCIGQEDECAPEIFRLPPESTVDWKIRVIQNLYPAIGKDLQPNPNAGGLVVTGFGFHDVVIESPVHAVHLSYLSPPEVAHVLLAYKKRIHQLSLHQSVQYVQVFKNHGASAGASMSHSHSQIMALLIVPPVSSRVDCMKVYFEQTGKCSVCEMPLKDLLIDESIHHIAIIPFAAAFPFEIWIVPGHHTPHFQEIDSEKAVDLGGLVKLMILKMSLQLNNPPFNFMIHASPLQDTNSLLPYAHWSLQIVPQLTVVGGFELGAGCYIDPVFSEDAAKVLREVNLPK